MSLEDQTQTIRSLARDPTHFQKLHVYYGTVLALAV